MTKSKRVPKENKWGDRSRFYKVGDKEYPSVTTILSSIAKPALVAWSAKVEREMVLEASAKLYLDVQTTEKMSEIGWRTALADRLGKMKASQKELQKASEIGSQAHEWIEHNIKAQLMHDVGPCPVISDAAMLAVGAWERWRNSVKFKPLLCEQPVWSHEHRYAGTMDLLAEINGTTTLLDWKTGKAVYAEAKLQNAAYRHALREMGLADVMDGMIVRLPKIEGDPDFEVVPVIEHEDALMEVFLQVRGLWEWLNAKEELIEVGAQT
jgi:hypothetical protein